MFTGIMLTPLLIGMLTLAFNIQPVKSDWTWTETIYIRADGSVDPDTAPISSVDNITYKLTDNIVVDVPEFSSAIVVERDSITVDGAGYALQGPGLYTGIFLTGRSNVTIKNMEIKSFNWGIRLSASSNNNIYGNNITHNVFGIWLYESSSYNNISGNSITKSKVIGHGIRLEGSSNYNTISGNSITQNRRDGIQFIESSSYNSISGNNIKNNNRYGIWLDVFSSYNTISGNSITNNDCGIGLGHSSNNKFYHNNFMGNTKHVCIYIPGYGNFWDNGYPSGGNYRSGYTGVDVKSGPNQDQPSSDGIGDSWYKIDQNNTDHYPLMGMFSDFSATSEYNVQTICNSTISDFQFNGTAISFNVTGEDGTAGFCRICIPIALMSEPYQVFVNGTEVSYDLLPISNSTHSYIYFSYEHSTKEVVIIPEFPSFLIIPLFMIATLLAVIVHRRKHTM